jgi:hypothetical protein
MKFRYIKAALKEKSSVFGSNVLKPIIPIGLINKERSLGFAALIDSGADFCIFPMGLAESLGVTIDKSKAEGFAGISGEPSRAYFSDLTIEIGGWRYKTLVSFSSDISPRGYGILGQKGFFDFFKVTFDLEKEEIELSPHF